MTEYRTVHDSRIDRPAEFDEVSSSFVVYQRKNIRQETTHDETSDADITMWVYEQRTMSHEEYALLAPALDKATKNAADIEYIAMMTDVTL